MPSTDEDDVAFFEILAPADAVDRLGIDRRGSSSPLNFLNPRPTDGISGPLLLGDPEEIVAEAPGHRVEGFPFGTKTLITVLNGILLF